MFEVRLKIAICMVAEEHGELNVVKRSMLASMKDTFRVFLISRFLPLFMSLGLVLVSNW